MGEEIKRIEAANQAQEQRQASRSTNLTGEQIFIRSCNVCHPGGKAGVGPSLIDLQSKYPSDEPLKKLIRKGAKNMPPQPETALNQTELDNLVKHLRVLAARLTEESK